MVLLPGLLLALSCAELAIRAAGMAAKSFQHRRNSRALSGRSSVRVMCIGDSMTFNQYPERLEELLNSAGKGVSFSVVDRALPCTNSMDTLASLKKDLDEVNPDIVLCMMGENDAAPGRILRVEKAVSPLQRLRLYRAWHYTKELLLKNGFSGYSVGGRKGDIASVGVDELLHTGESCLTGGDYACALTAAETALGTDPRNTFALQLKCGAQRLSGDFEGAVKTAEELLSLDSGNSLAYDQLCAIYFYRRDGKGFRSAVEKLLQASPDNPSGPMTCARYAYYYFGYRDLSDRLFAQAVSAAPRDQGVLLQTAEYQLKNRRKPGLAKPLLERVIGLNPGSAETAKARTLLSDIGSYPEIPDKEQDRMAARYLLEKRGVARPPVEIPTRPVFPSTKSTEPGAYDLVVSGNYLALKKMLDARNITLLAMQYPTRSLAPLKYVFAEQTGVYFVSNEGLKQLAVRDGYEKYFTDLYAGDFGHCTDAGNAIMAANAAEVILRQVIPGR